MLFEALDGFDKRCHSAKKKPCSYVLFLEGNDKERIVLFNLEDLVNPTVARVSHVCVRWCYFMNNHLFQLCFCLLH